MAVEKESETRVSAPPVVDAEDATPRAGVWTLRRTLGLLMFVSGLFWLLLGIVLRLIFF